MRLLSRVIGVLLFGFTGLTSLAIPVIAANTHSATFTSNANKNLQAADSASLDITGALTLQFAIKLAAGTPADSQGVVTKYNTSNHSYFCQRNTDNRLNCGVSLSGGATVTVTTATALTASQWYCVVFVYVPSTSLTIYLSPSGCGSVPVQDAQNTTSIPASIFSGTAAVMLGAFQQDAGTASNVLSAQLDDVRIFSSDRSSNFASDYNCKLSGSETNLAAYWTLDDTLDDATANHNDLTNNNSVAFTTDRPWTADCAAPAVTTEVPNTQVIMVGI